ncbi:trigger factor [Reichenbachiella agarivorans]|uniref:Trigger factor n=1 Tax=Reichenbachiella agarivorans TaxID=2979464 RepID=A0ABY6CQB3_9BACT|nr:trigger factor [Reichenbachiella agarivorans]UXP32691.1 trigger factor [Reichenbachiella agarivorans]
MDIQLDQISKTEALIKISLKEADYQPKVEEKIKEYGKKASIKGFRPGKVPMSVIRKMYGKSVLVDEINQMVSRQVMDYIKEKEIQLLGEPLPNQDKIAEQDWDTAKDFDFEYSIGMAPEFEVSVDKKVKVDTFAIKVDDKLINETLENLKNQFGDVTNPETAEEGDSLYGFIQADGEEEPAGTTLDLKEVEKKDQKNFIGKKSGDTIEFDPSKSIKNETVRAQFLGDNAESKGKITFEIKNVNRTTPAELNQELFDKVFGKDQVKTEAEFIEKVRTAISDNYTRETDGYTQLKIRDTFIDNIKIELPDEFLKRWLKVSNKDITDEQIETEYPLYTNDLRWSMIKNKIAKANDIKVENQDVVDEAKNMIRQQFGSMGMSEQMEANIDAFADNYLRAENGNNYMKLHETVFNDRIIAFIKENVTIKAKEVSAEEYREKA